MHIPPRGRIEMIRHKHILEEYKNLMEWAKRIAERPAV